MTQKRNIVHIFTEFGMSMKLVRPIIKCLNETYRKVRTYKSNAFPIQNGLK
jgi:hypothetical protein